MRHHDRPWKCTVQSCEYAEIGFLSRKMRDEHLESSHQEIKSQSELVPSNPDVDELQPLFFDLIRLDKVEAVKNIQHHFSKLDEAVQTELLHLVASSGSASMALVLCNGRSKPEMMNICISSIKSMNFETLRWFLSRIDTDIYYCDKFYRREPGPLHKALVESGSLEIFKEWEKHFIKILPKNSEWGKSLMHEIVSAILIKATAGISDREHLLLSIWAFVETRTENVGFGELWGDGLTNVAKTTCSIVLAKALLEYGVAVDFKKVERSPTTLHYAARNDSPQAAELMKFLLYNGANPEPLQVRSKFKISEEKGARNIAKWVGMSWEELVQKIKLDRERGFCPPEYR